jgi:hypothetical protein
MATLGQAWRVLARPGRARLDRVRHGKWSGTGRHPGSSPGAARKARMGMAPQGWARQRLGWALHGVARQGRWPGWSYWRFDSAGGRAGHGGSRPGVARPGFAGRGREFNHE